MTPCYLMAAASSLTLVRDLCYYKWAALLIGVLAASGLTVDSLLQLSEDQQKEALIAAATRHSARGDSPRPTIAISGTAGSPLPVTPPKPAAI